MTSTELEKLIRKELTTAGLWEQVDQHKSQFLEFPDGLFAEVVLTDGSKLVETEGIVRELRESLRKSGTELDVIVRSTWIVQSIESPQPAIGLSGGIRAAWAFPATLVSGGLTTNVEVDVTQSAIDEIRRKLTGGSPESMDEKAVMREVVKEFLKLQLSFGGESYWDPIRYPKQELNEAALLYLLGHTTVGKR